MCRQPKKEEAPQVDSISPKRESPRSRATSCRAVYDDDHFIQ